MSKILALCTCFNRKEMTANCLRTMQECSHSIDYIITDDNSTDGTKEYLSELDNVTIVEGTGSSFYSGGMRLAIKKAKGDKLANYDYVLFFNDDVKFFPNAMDRLVETAGDSGEIVVGAVCDSGGKHAYGGVVKTRLIKPSFDNVEITAENLYCDTCCANCVLIPAAVFEQLDNIDPVYRHAMGDFDYFFEAGRKGFKIRSTDFYVGECNDNPITGGWRDTTLTRKERLRKKESVKGLPKREWFHYLLKNHGLISAIIYSATPYLRIILRK